MEYRAVRRSGGGQGLSLLPTRLCKEGPLMPSGSTDTSWEVGENMHTVKLRQFMM